MCSRFRLLGLDVAGVDLFGVRKRATLLEVDPSPGLEGIEKATGVTGHIMAHVVENHAFTPLNLNQLLSNKEGHGNVTLKVRGNLN